MRFSVLLLLLLGCGSSNGKNLDKPEKYSSACDPTLDGSDRCSRCVPCLALESAGQVDPVTLYESRCLAEYADTYWDAVSICARGVAELNLKCIAACPDIPGLLAIDIIAREQDYRCAWEFAECMDANMEDCGPTHDACVQ